MRIFVKLKNYTTMKEFIELVREMRNAQKEYFKTRSRDLLSKSKQLEKQVDDEIKRAKEGASQTALF
jgi:hypothetical protein